MPNIHKLDAITVKNASPKAKEYKLSDGGGLYLRIRPTGVKSWIFRFRIGNSRKLLTMTVGAIEEMSLKEARSALPGLRKLVAQGIDPRNARAATKAENSQAITMQAIFDAWIDSLKLAGQVTPKWIKRHEDRWKLHLKQPLKNILTKDITRAHLAEALDAMSQQGIKEETRKALTTLNLMLDYGLVRHKLEVNPARVLKPKDFSASANRARARALSVAELRNLWASMDKAITKRKGLAKTVILSSVTAVAMKVLILTGARRSEVAGMRWEELDLKEGVWHIPAERTKNRQAHSIFLGSLALELINTMWLLNQSSEFVFYTGRDNSHIHPDSLTTAISRLIKAHAKCDDDDKNCLKDMKPFSVHDLRRSAATAWGEVLKTPPHIIERMLNHQPLNKLVATYQRAVYSEEQKTAWLAWDAVVKTQIAKDLNNVLPFKKAANT